MKNTNDDDISPPESGSGTSKKVDAPDMSKKASEAGSPERLGNIVLVGCALAFFAFFAVLGGIIGGCMAAIIIYILAHR